MLPQSMVLHFTHASSSKVSCIGLLSANTVIDNMLSYHRETALQGAL